MCEYVAVYGIGIAGDGNGLKHTESLVLTRVVVYVKRSNSGYFAIMKFRFL